MAKLPSTFDRELDALVEAARRVQCGVCKAALKNPKLFEFVTKRHAAGTHTLAMLHRLIESHGINVSEWTLQRHYRQKHNERGRHESAE